MEVAGGHGLGGTIDGMVPEVTEGSPWRMVATRMETATKKKDWWDASVLIATMKTTGKCIQMDPHVQLEKTVSPRLNASRCF